MGTTTWHADLGVADGFDVDDTAYFLALFRETARFAIEKQTIIGCC